MPEGRTCEIPSRKPARYTGRDHSASLRQTMPVRAAGLQLAACEPGPHPAPAARRNPAQANAAGTSANAADTATAQTHAAQMRQHSAATEVPASTTEMHAAAAKVPAPTAEMHAAATAAEVSTTASTAEASATPCRLSSQGSHERHNRGQHDCANCNSAIFHEYLLPAAEKSDGPMPYPTL